MSTSVTIRRHRPCREGRWQLSAGILAAALLAAASVQAQAPSDAAPATSPAVVAPTAGTPTAPPVAATPAPAKPGVAGKQKMTSEEMIRLNPTIHPSAFARNYDELGVPAAIEKARKGDGEELFRLIQSIGKRPYLLPPKKTLPTFHGYLKDPNPLVQFLGVRVIAGLKDASSVKPLQDYIMDAQKQKLDPRSLPRMEGVALEMAQSMALAALGEIDTKSSVTKKVLIAVLAHDQPMEWGGGVAHDALAKRGREGLLTLMAESEQLDCKAYKNGRQVDFISSAICKIKDPALLPDLYAVGMNPKYFFRLRGDALMSIGTMAVKNPEAEQIIIDITRNKDTDIRNEAISQLGRIGSQNTLQVLKELLNDNGLNAKSKESVMTALLRGDTDNMIDGYIQRILSKETPDKSKIFMCQIIQGLKNEKLERHVDRLKCLFNVTDAGGKPLNEARLIVWKKIYDITNNIYDLELEYKSDKYLKHQTEICSVARDIDNDLFFKIRTSPNKFTPAEKNLASIPQEKRYEAIKNNIMSQIKKWK